MLIVYNLKTGEVVENHGTNTAFPVGRPDEEQVKRETVAKFGGTAADYGLYRLHDISNADLIQKIYKYEHTIRDNQLVFGNKLPIPEPEQKQPTELELVQQENAQLQLGMMELSMYAAAQDDKLVQQEVKLAAQDNLIKNHDSALMELSMILAGGM